MTSVRTFLVAVASLVWLVATGNEGLLGVAKADEASAEQTAMADDKFSIGKAEWKVKREELRVKVNASPGIEFHVTSATDHDNILATHIVKESDRGSLKIQIPGEVVPCGIRVVRAQDGKVLEASVEDAPNCSE